MVSYCCVKGCRNNSKNKKNDPNSLISFHAFPSHPGLKSKWLRAIGRLNWSPPSHARVCSAHFINDQINYDGSRIRLKDDAVPGILLPLNSNFEASNVEACRICLATDAKMYSLLHTVLGACMETVTERNENFNIGGLPQFICYKCTPNLIKSSELIEKCIESQTILLDIFAKNGQITIDLIKEHGQSPELKSSSIREYAKIISDFDVTKSELNESDTYLKNEKAQSIKIEMEDIEKSNIEENELIVDNNESCPTGAGFIPDDDFIEDSSSNNVQDGKESNIEVNHTRKKTTRMRKSGSTPAERDMMKYFNIVELSLQEQIREWENSTVRRPLKSDTVYQCEVCKKIFANASSYHVHTANHDASLGQAECPVCKLRFRSAAMAASHKKRAHSKKFFCKMCPKAFNNVGVAKKHQRWHSGHMYKCAQCPFVSRHECSLGAHRRSAHAHDGAISCACACACALCGRAFSSARGRRIHAHTKHGINTEKDIIKEYRCEQCDIGFASENARRVHILTSIQHAKKPNLCDETNLRKCCKKCGKDCGSFKELVQHNRAEHGRVNRGRSSKPWRGDAPYPVTCEICGESISTRQKHWLHVRRHHPKEVDTYQPVIAAVCDTCGKGYQNTTKLRLHKLRHRSPTVRCQLCPRLFYDRYALMRHARTHNADKPYQCRVCGRAFKVQSNLDRHARVHTDATPYECTMCGKKFKHSSSVNLHVRTVHYKLPQPPRKKRSKSTKDKSDS